MDRKFAKQALCLYLDHLSSQRNLLEKRSAVCKINQLINELEDGANLFDSIAHVYPEKTASEQSLLAVRLVKGLAGKLEKSSGLKYAPGSLQIEPETGKSPVESFMRQNLDAANAEHADAVKFHGAFGHSVPDTPEARAFNAKRDSWQEDLDSLAPSLKRDRGVISGLNAEKKQLAQAPNPVMNAISHPVDTWNGLSTSGKVGVGVGGAAAGAAGIYALYKLLHKDEKKEKYAMSKTAEGSNLEGGLQELAANATPYLAQAGNAIGQGAMGLAHGADKAVDFTTDKIIPEIKSNWSGLSDSGRLAVGGVGGAAALYALYKLLHKDDEEQKYASDMSKEAWGRWGAGNGPLRQMIANRRGGSDFGDSATSYSAPAPVPVSAPVSAPKSKPAPQPVAQSVSLTPESKPAVKPPQSSMSALAARAAKTLPPSLENGPTNTLAEGPAAGSDKGTSLVSAKSKGAPVSAAASRKSIPNRLAAQDKAENDKLFAPAKPASTANTAPTAMEGWLAKTKAELAQRRAGEQPALQQAVTAANLASTRKAKFESQKAQAPGMLSGYGASGKDVMDQIRGSLDNPLYHPVDATTRSFRSLGNMIGNGWNAASGFLSRPFVGDSGNLPKAVR